MAKRGTRGSRKGKGISTEPESPVQAFIKSEMEIERENEFPKDDEFDPGYGVREGRFVESAARLMGEERVIDELLASVPRNQGYYLKIYKELRPNEFELKLRVDNYDSWTDLEWEITNIVRQYTIKDPKKWGTGCYRVIIWRDGGIRGEKFKPLVFFVDAMEPAHTDPPVNTGTAGGLGMVENFSQLSEMLRTMRDVNPTVSPADMQAQMTTMFQKGMEIAASKDAAKASESNTIIASMMTMMGTIMTGMMNKPQQTGPSLTELMQLIQANKPVEQPRESITDQIVKFRELGLISKPEATDPVSKIAEMKNLMGMLSEFSGSKYDRPTLTEKLIESVGPQIPLMLAKVVDTVNKVIDYRKMKEGLMPAPAHVTPAHVAPNAIPGATAPRISTNPVPTAGTAINENEESAMFFNQLLTELHAIVSDNDESKFPYLKQRIAHLFGGEQVLIDIAAGTMPMSTILTNLANFGGEKYQDAQFMVALENYFGRFIQWYKVATSSAQAHVEGNAFTVSCGSCNEMYDYDSEAHFDGDSDKKCDSCGGVLTKMSSHPDTIVQQ